MIPAQNMEIEQIYSQVLGRGKQSIAICAASPGEGVTSVATALGQHNLLAGHSTLLVDLNLYRPALNSLLGLSSTSIDNKGLLGQSQLVSTANHQVAITGVTAPNRRDIILKLRKPGVLEQCISEWHQMYDTVIIDTSPINNINSKNVPPDRVAAACDGCLLVVLAGQTDEMMVSRAIHTLNAADVNLLGCVYNDRDNPILKDELIRETHRLKPRYTGIAQRLEKWFKNNRLLSIEV